MPKGNPAVARHVAKPDPADRGLGAYKCPLPPAMRAQVQKLIEQALRLSRSEAVRQRNLAVIIELNIELLWLYPQIDPSDRKRREWTIANLRAQLGPQAPSAMALLDNLYQSQSQSQPILEGKRHVS